MGNQKQKWTAEEEAALKAGVAKHGAGKWKNIIVDPEFAATLANRSNVDLKDKWRNMGVNHGNGGRDSSVTPKAKATASTYVVPKTQNSSSVSKEKSNDSPPHSPQDEKNIPKYSTMILEALSSSNDPCGTDIGTIAGFIEQKYGVLPNFRMSLGSKLSRLVLQGKLEKVLQGYKIKDSRLGTKPSTLAQTDARQRQIQQPRLIPPLETVEEAADAAAQWITEAENKAFVAAQAFKEAERVSQMADDTDAMCALCKEFLEQCSCGEFVLED